MESELFGHKRGSFTGAVTDKRGLIQSAEGGTLFLDEIADLPLHMQVKLLRVIQEKSVRPIGEQAEVSVDVRLLSATHKDLGQLVADAKFREDLFYRVNVIEMRVPPLRDRLEDVPELAEAASRTGDVEAARAALDWLSGHSRGTPTEWAQGIEAYARAVVSEGAVEKHVANIFAKLSLPVSENDHRRVLAVLRFLES